MAQQEPIVIECGYLGGTISEEVKTKLRKCFLRGTIMDVQLDCDTDDIDQKEKVKVLSYRISNENGLFVWVFSAYDGQATEIGCGEFQPSDYEDNAPLDK